MTIPLACDMDAIPLAERGEHQRATRRLLASAAEIQPVPHGFAFQLSADDYEAAVQFVARERLCCPFLRFALEVTPGRGPVRLRVDGPPGTREFLRAELDLP
jgi:hypothetical protein